MGTYLGHTGCTEFAKTILIITLVRKAAAKTHLRYLLRRLRRTREDRKEKRQREKERKKEEKRKGQRRGKIKPVYRKSIWLA